MAPELYFKGSTCPKVVMDQLVIHAIGTSHALKNDWHSISLIRGAEHKGVTDIQYCSSSAINLPRKLLLYPWSSKSHSEQKPKQSPVTDS